jgi:translation initiation factor 2 beta subunit (eIF-2beta)/eIF-5
MQTRDDIRFDFLEDFSLELNSKKNKVTNLREIGEKYNIDPALFAIYLNNFCGNLFDKVQWRTSDDTLFCSFKINESEMRDHLRDFYNKYSICQFCATTETIINRQMGLRRCNRCLQVTVVDLFSKD